MTATNPNEPASAGIVMLDLRNRPLSDVLQEIERTYLSHAMTEASGNKAQAARLSGITEETFRRKLSRYTVRAVYNLA